MKKKPGLFRIAHGSKGLGSIAGRKMSVAVFDCGVCLLVDGKALYSTPSACSFDFRRARNLMATEVYLVK
jgi:hypothetical protein